SETSVDDLESCSLAAFTINQSAANSPLFALACCFVPPLTIRAYGSWARRRPSALQNSTALSLSPLEPPHTPICLGEKSLPESILHPCRCLHVASVDVHSLGRLECARLQLLRNVFESAKSKALDARC